MRYRDTIATLANYEDAITAHLQPLLPGSACSGPYPGKADSSFDVSFDTAHRLHVSLPVTPGRYLVFERILPFTEEERAFMEEVARMIRTGMEKEPLQSIDTFISRAVSDVIVKRVAPEFPDSVRNVIRIYEEWVGQHKAQPLAGHATGIRLMRKTPGQNNFFSMDKEFLRALGSSPDTLIVINAEGGICGVEKIPSVSSAHTARQEVLAPVIYADMAAWSNSRRKAVVRLTEGGDILLFSRRELLFAKRGVYWCSFPHSLINIKALPESIEGVEPETVRAVYLTALDLSAGNAGAYIGLFRDVREQKARTDPRKAGQHLLTRESSKNAQLLAGMVKGKRFAEISRAVRAEICALGGVLILDGQGSILGLHLSGSDFKRHFAEASRTGVYPGKGYMELFNRSGQSRLLLCIY